MCMVSLFLFRIDKTVEVEQRFLSDASVIIQSHLIAQASSPPPLNSKARQKARF